MQFQHTSDRLVHSLLPHFQSRHVSIKVTVQSCLDCQLGRWNIHAYSLPLSNCASFCKQMRNLIYAVQKRGIVTLILIAGNILNYQGYWTFTFASSQLSCHTFANRFYNIVQQSLRSYIILHQAVQVLTPQKHCLLILEQNKCLFLFFFPYFLFRYFPAITRTFFLIRWSR